jgi:chromosome partitioning protein
VFQVSARVLGRVVGRASVHRLGRSGSASLTSAGDGRTARLPRQHAFRLPAADAGRPSRRGDLAGLRTPLAKSAAVNAHLATSTPTLGSHQRLPKGLRVLEGRAHGGARVLALANQKGGVAKTTSTVNLAAALVEEGRRVLVCDLDPQSNLTMSQGFDPERLERSMYDVLVHKLPIEEIVQHAEFDLAVASIELAGAELALASMIGRERALEKALLTVRRDYDYVLIDTPPSLGLITINALTASDGIIVPVQCEYLSLRGLAQLEATLHMIRENLNPRVAIVGILPTMFDGRLVHAREAIEILEENFGNVVFKTRIRKTVRYAEAPVQGQSVLRYDPMGTAAQAYRELAKEVLALDEATG